MAGPRYEDEQLIETTSQNTTLATQAVSLKKSTL